MQPEEIRNALSEVLERFAAHPEEGKSEDRPARAVIHNGLRARIDGPGSWSITTDMPTALGGEGSAPSPGWLRRAAQAACEATTIAMRAAQEGIVLDSLEVTVGSASDDRGLLGVPEGIPAGPQESWARVRLSAKGIPPQKLQQLVQWAEEHSPVTDSLRRSVPHTLTVEIL